MLLGRSFNRALALLTLCAILFHLQSNVVTAAPPHAPPETYVVQSGDTLYAIALKYHLTVAALKQMNKLGASDTILVGQKLLVPSSDSTPAQSPANSSTYIVQSGDTLFRIAIRYGITMRVLEELNDIPNPNLISVGQPIVIPNTPTLVKPGIVVSDSPTARQGGTLFIQIAQPGLASITGSFNNHDIPFTRAAGYFYALVGISRCAKLGSVSFKLSETELSGEAVTDNMTINVATTAFPINAITLPPSKLAILTDQALIKREADQLSALVNKFTPTRLWSGAYRLPINTYITEYFGTRRSYNGGPVGACGHEGTDFGGKVGDPIYSDARGRVVFAGPTQVRGNMVIVDHGLGIFSGYYHQSEVAVQLDQMVESGDLIGKVGSTGLATGPHLHWSMWAAGEYVDPLEWTRKVLP